jgi:hypothetical protein
MNFYNQDKHFSADRAELSPFSIHNILDLNSKKLIRPAISLLVILCSLMALPSQEITLRVQADSYTDSAYPFATHGTAPIISINNTRSGYIRFNLDDLPDNLQITHAYLRVWINNKSIIQPGLVDVYAATSDWQEESISQANMPILSNNWISSFNIEPANKNNFVSVEITSIVQNWQQNHTTNFGLVLVSNPHYQVSVNFDSKESPSINNPIEIEVAFDGDRVPGNPFATLQQL